MDHVNNFLILTRRSANETCLPSRQQIRPKVWCLSGLRMSIQASEFHYSHPRTNTPPYTAVEIGYPNRYIPEFAPYLDLDTVYGYVPVAIVNQVIEDNGGITQIGE